MATVDFTRYRRIVQRFWDPEPTNDTAVDQPVWCLGSSYTLADSTLKGETSISPVLLPSPPGSFDAASLSAGGSEPSKAEARPETDSTGHPPTARSDGHDGEGGWPHPFLDDFEAKLWMTYRSGFDPIPRSSHPDAFSALSFSMKMKSQLADQNGFSSDSGWGCMIRSGQSLLANAISIQRLGRSWRRNQLGPDEKSIIAMFADDRRAPYSIHNFVRHGAACCGKYPGEWFGPSATARCIQALVNEHDEELRVYSTGDGPDVYEDEFMNIAKPQGGRFKPTLVLVGTRLGIDKITPVYWDSLIASLQLPQSVGIAGGRPSSSHYFIGAQGPYLFYLDPHHTRPALPYHSDSQLYSDEEVDSCHTRRLRKLHVREMDPSMLIGFIIKDEDDWFEWRKSIKHVQGKAVISVSDHNPLSSRNSDGHATVDDVQSLSEDEHDIEGVDDDEGIVVLS